MSPGTAVAASNRPSDSGTHTNNESKAEINDGNERSKCQVCARSVDRWRHKANRCERMVRRHVETLQKQPITLQCS